MINRNEANEMLKNKIREKEEEEKAIAQQKQKEFEDFCAQYKDGIPGLDKEIERQIEVAVNNTLKLFDIRVDYWLSVRDSRVVCIKESTQDNSNHGVVCISFHRKDYVTQLSGFFINQIKKILKDAGYKNEHAQVEFQYRTTSYRVRVYLDESYYKEDEKKIDLSDVRCEKCGKKHCDKCGNPL